MFFDHQIAH